MGIYGTGLRSAAANLPPRVAFRRPLVTVNWAPSESTARFFAAWLKSYGLTEERLAEYRGNPVDNLEPLARARIPLLHVVGDADDVVPVAENTAILEARYKQLGGQITVIHKPGVGHHPHSLKDPAPIVDFVVRYAAPHAN